MLVGKCEYFVGKTENKHVRILVLQLNKESYII